VKVLEDGRRIHGSGLETELLRELFLLTAKPFLYVFNCDQDELADDDLKDRMRQVVAPAEAIFLDAKFESELVEMDEDEGRGVPGRCRRRRTGPRRAGARRLRHPRSAVLPDGGSEGRPGPGPFRRERRPPRPRASSTPTSRRASSKPR